MKNRKKTNVLNLRISDNELSLLKKMAKKYTDNNISKFLRFLIDEFSKNKEKRR